MSNPPYMKRSGRPELPVWELTVIDAFDVTPRMRRVVVTGDLSTMIYSPGQALVLAMPLPEGGTPIAAPVDRHRRGHGAARPTCPGIPAVTINSRPLSPPST